MPAPTLPPSEPSFLDSAAFLQDPPLATRLTQYHRRLTRRNEATPGTAWVVDGLAAVHKALATIREEGLRPGATEAAWMAVHQVRQALCLHDDRPTLLEIAHEVQSDFLDCAIVPPTWRAESQALVQELVSGVAAPGPLLRNRLYSLAILAAGRRESDWRRANHVVSRRFRASVAVVVVTLILLVVLPFGFEHIAVGEGIGPMLYSWAREAGCILAVLMCGALGGLMSVLLRQEQLLMTSVEHHVIVATTKLRPIVGAASALVFFIVWESGLLQMADSGHRKAGVVSGTMLLIAVVAGFSERLLLGQIEKLSAALEGATRVVNAEPIDPKLLEAPSKQAESEAEEDKENEEKEAEEGEKKPEKKRETRPPERPEPAPASAPVTEA